MAVGEHNKLWFLQQAAQPFGFLPNSKSVNAACHQLASEGLLRESDNSPFWGITEKGKAVLAALSATELV